ncbi:hypothetical protein [Nocardiopsis halophila]|uniref:hypothetical protein n=1 Tax=Nocardiopsis halophila TaxID=141692 RepID=UPI000377854C|nr:hypothetical protein [Nocardiopsis halophila]
MQAGSIHDSTVYMVQPDDPPSRRYEVGLRYLNNGVPRRALELIDEAIAKGHDGPEVRFHWALAMLSGRSYRDLTTVEHGRLSELRQDVCSFRADDWTQGSEAICDLLSCLEGREGDASLAFKRLNALPSAQRDKIIRHLDLVLTGGMKASLWAESCQAAREGRLDGDRRGRVWAYFHPEPAGARARRPVGAPLTWTGFVGSTPSSAVLVLAVGSIIVTALFSRSVAAIVSLPLFGAAVYFGAVQGLQWYRRVRWIRLKDSEHLQQRFRPYAPGKGFANQVDHAFTHYFATYRPHLWSSEQWLATTAGIRSTLRDEVVEIYRESGTASESVRWLIRFMARDVRARWVSGTLLEHRERYKVAHRTRLSFAAACAGAAVTGLVLLGTAVVAAPVLVTLASITAVVAGALCVPTALNHCFWHWAHHEDRRLRERTLAEREAEYRRWKGKLDALRPSEEQMEEWLRCDRTLILDRALKHYRLGWHDILAHCFLQTPHQPCKQARTMGGPWRYSRYVVTVFLVTKDGVREVSVELDFENAEFGNEERRNFRFDAVSSVHVEQTSGYGYVLSLTLMNGAPRSITIIEPATEESMVEEDQEKISRLNLDSSGFTPTLRILEGIAADGKNWIERDQRPSGTGYLRSEEMLD